MKVFSFFLGWSVNQIVMRPHPLAASKFRKNFILELGHESYVKYLEQHKINKKISSTGPNDLVKCLEIVNLAIIWSVPLYARLAKVS